MPQVPPLLLLVGPNPKENVRGREFMKFNKVRKLTELYAGHALNQTVIIVLNKNIDRS